MIMNRYFLIKGVECVLQTDNSIKLPSVINPSLRRDVICPLP